MIPSRPPSPPAPPETFPVTTASCFRAAVFLAAVLSFQACAGSEASLPVRGEGCVVQRGTLAQAAERPSPLDSTKLAVGDREVTLCYGRPSARERDIMGGLVPWGEPWRLGADEPTTIHTPVGLFLGEVPLEPGSYSLYVVPEPDRWTVYVNDEWRRWGIPIDDGVRASELGSLTVHPEPTRDHVETLQARFEPPDSTPAELVFEWERTRIRIPVRAAGGGSPAG